MAEHPTSEITFGTYYVRPGNESRFEALMPRNWATLRTLGFVVDELPALYRSVAEPAVYVEQVRWQPGAMDPAHEHPDVIPLWTELAALLEPRTPEVADRGLSFAEFVQVDVAAVDAAV